MSVLKVTCISRSESDPEGGIELNAQFVLTLAERVRHIEAVRNKEVLRRPDQGTV